MSDKDVLEIWPARVSDKETTAVEMDTREDGAKGGWDPSSNRAIIPVGPSAAERTIRLHESLHAIYTEGKPTDSFVDQAVEDAKMHLLHAQTKGSVRRDELAMALQELRYVRAFPAIPEARDGGFLMALRAKAIIEGGPKSKFADKAFQEALKAEAFNDPNMPLFFNPDTAKRTMDMALQFIREGDMQAAKDVINIWFSGQPMKMVREKMEGMGFGRSGDFHLPSKPGVGYTEIPQFLTESVEMLPEKTLQQIAYLKDCYPQMDIEKLPSKHTFVSTYKGPSEKLVLCGAHIRAKKLALSIAPTPPRMFVRKARHLHGGTVLIDASGSMSIPDPVLTKVAEKIPLGTVAYYVGVGRRERAGKQVTYGNLVIYSENGRRYKHPDKSKALPHREHGDNLVDFPALQWLLKQPGPRYYVTDVQFTGDYIFVLASKQLFNNALRKGLFTHCNNLTDLCGKLNINTNEEEEED